MSISSAQVLKPSVILISFQFAVRDIRFPSYSSSSSFCSFFFLFGDVQFIFTSVRLFLHITYSSFSFRALPLALSWYFMCHAYMWSMYSAMGMQQDAFVCAVPPSRCVRARCAAKPFRCIYYTSHDCDYDVLLCIIFIVW